MPYTQRARDYFHEVAEGRVKDPNLSRAKARQLAAEADSMPVLPPVKKKAAPKKKTVKRAVKRRPRAKS